MTLLRVDWKFQEMQEEHSRYYLVEWDLAAFLASIKRALTERTNKLRSSPKLHLHQSGADWCTGSAR